MNNFGRFCHRTGRSTTFRGLRPGATTPGNPSRSGVIGNFPQVIHNGFSAGFGSEKRNPLRPLGRVVLENGGPSELRMSRGNDPPADDSSSCGRSAPDRSRPRVRAVKPPSSSATDRTRRFPLRFPAIGATEPSRAPLRNSPGFPREDRNRPSRKSRRAGRHPPIAADRAANPRSDRKDGPNPPTPNPMRDMWT